MSFSSQDWFLYLVVASMLFFIVVLGFVSLTDRDPPETIAAE